MSDYVMQADRYYGSTARDYEKKRSIKPDWQREQNAVSKMVTSGPVLDVPVGTGRYLQIYKDKGFKFQGIDASHEMIAQAHLKHADLIAKRGCITDLPFKGRQFGTVVCSRLLNWLYPVDMAKAVQEMRRVGKQIVTSIRLGEKGHHEGQANYTHSRQDFYAAIDGLFIESYEWILTAPDGEFGFYKLRKPTWADVKTQFAWHRDTTNAIQRLADNWIDRLKIKPVHCSKGSIRAEQWHAERIKLLIERLASVPNIEGQPNCMLTDEQPHSEDGPLVIVRTQGREFMLDGRRRSNKWMHGDSWHQMLVIEA